MPNGYSGITCSVSAAPINIDSVGEQRSVPNLSFLFFAMQNTFDFDKPFDKLRASSVTEYKSI